MQRVADTETHTHTHIFGRRNVCKSHLSYRQCNITATEKRQLNYTSAVQCGELHYAVFLPV